MKRELAGIQYLRAAAIFMVVCFHASTMMGFGRYFAHKPFWPLLGYGFSGVDLFFSISGFIIAYVSLNVDLKPVTALRPFLERRFARIIPFMWIAVICYAPLRYLARENFPVDGYLRSLILFPSGQLIPPQLWALRNEGMFYIVFALTALRGRWWLFGAWIAAPFVMWLTA